MLIPITLTCKTSEEPIHINPAHISTYFSNEEGGTLIELLSNRSINVLEDHTKVTRLLQSAFKTSLTRAPQ